QQPAYPEALRAILDPPLVLAVRGKLLPGDARAVAVVGARRATPAGREIAHRLGFDLAASGVTVVSGLARGIDQAAHRGALEAGGRTLAVLGCGLGVDYPAGRLARELSRRIAERGALLSEFAPLQAPAKYTFPQRNRIVAGLSLGVVVVEASSSSGALITADLALQSGRELFAVPGSVLEPLSRGPNGLLKDGAYVVESAADVLEVLFGVASPTQTPPAEELEEREAG
ncbi:MAG: DNA-processing protein DprA, partial [Planctomycetes bacterium]|nr:DNA-processing protein DprA [Planctomycetota bacterium]